MTTKPGTMEAMDSTMLLPEGIEISFELGGAAHSSNRARGFKGTLSNHSPDKHSITSNVNRCPAINISEDEYNISVPDSSFTKDQKSLSSIDLSARANLLY